MEINLRFRVRLHFSTKYSQDLACSLPYADDSDAMTIASVSCKAFDDEYGDDNDDDMYNSVTGSILSTPTNDWKPPRPPLMLPEPPRSQYNGWQNGLREDSHTLDETLPTVLVQAKPLRNVAWRELIFRAPLK